MRSLRCRLVVTGLAVVSLPGCSVKSLAVNSIGNALAEGTSSFATDDDPELVREAVPFGLKTMESLLDASPRHQGLLYATSSGFCQYAYAFLQQDADFVEATDLARATALRARARRLYLRGRDYGLRGLEVDFPGFREALRRDPQAALAPMQKKHLPSPLLDGVVVGGGHGPRRERLHPGRGPGPPRRHDAQGTRPRRELRARLHPRLLHRLRSRPARGGGLDRRGSPSTSSGPWPSPTDGGPGPTSTTRRASRWPSRTRRPSNSR